MAKGGQSNCRGKYNEFFDEADTGDDGRVDKLELCKCLVKKGCAKTVAEMADWFDEIDVDDDDCISRDEFLKAMEQKDPADITQKQLENAFDLIDTDGSGCITLCELKEALRKAGESDDISDLDMDENDDGKVDRREFLDKFMEVYKCK